MHCRGFAILLLHTRERGTEKMLTWIDWLMILGYFGVLAGVVVFSLRRNKIESGENPFAV